MGRVKAMDKAQLKRETRVETFRGSGPGGQHRNKVETAVRATHVPSGLTAMAADTRSQYRNRELALNRLEEKLDRLTRRPKPRKRTRLSRAARERRVDAKRRRGEKKATRGRLRMGE